MPPSLEVAVISLQTAQERRRTITSQFASSPHEWAFFDAHTSLINADLRYDADEILRTYGRTLSPAQLAVWSSHYSVIQNFLENSRCSHLLVFEDDVLFDTKFPLIRLASFCSDHGIHYVRLYGMYHTPAANLSYFFDRSIVRYKSSPAGAQAYLMSKEGARRFTEASRQVDTAVDLAMDYFWRTGLPIYSVFPFPVIERFTPSSIPILPATALEPKVRFAWNRTRIANKLRKWRANARLASKDSQIRNAALDFQQVHAADVASSGSGAPQLSFGGMATVGTCRAGQPDQPA